MSIQKLTTEYDPIWASGGLVQGEGQCCEVHAVEVFVYGTNPVIVYRVPVYLHTSGHRAWIFPTVSHPLISTIDFKVALTVYLGQYGKFAYGTCFVSCIIRI